MWHGSMALALTSFFFISFTLCVCFDVRSCAIYVTFVVCGYDYISVSLPYIFFTASNNKPMLAVVFQAFQLWLSKKMCTELSSIVVIIAVQRCFVGFYMHSWLFLCASRSFVLLLYIDFGRCLSKWYFDTQKINFATQALYRYSIRLRGILGWCDTIKFRR